MLVATGKVWDPKETRGHTMRLQTDASNKAGAEEELRIGAENAVEERVAIW